MSVVSLTTDIDPSYRAVLTSEDTALFDCFTRGRPSVDERMAAGRALRASVPRRTHARHEGRESGDALAILASQCEGRISELLPLRYARMLTSPFAFLRGSAAVMASDLSATPLTGLAVAACGDSHVKNFGVFASAERNLIFGINDFDEVHPGPWEWDLKRRAASAAVAVRFWGGDDRDAEEAIRRAVNASREAMHRYAPMGALQTWYSRIDQKKILAAIPSRWQRVAREILNTARRHGNIRALEKLTDMVDGDHRIVERPPVIVRETESESGSPIQAAIARVLGGYLASLTEDRRRLISRYRLVDVARKVVGVGSVGTSCWVVLLEGTGKEDPLFLQVKEARRSVLSSYVDMKLPFSHQGRRVVAGQRLIQGSPDIFLGWSHEGPKEFYVRQLADMKGGFDETARGALRTFAGYAALCGEALALAHAKSGDAAMIAGYCGKSERLDDALTLYAHAYADQTERDHAALMRARREGRIEARLDEAEA
ncbi:MAG: DUF2252 domain-containing protein [Polyangiaceae bacterium]|nr:DUF2252 domain-containing protein [Polyangiaceae bacterium]